MNLLCSVCVCVCWVCLCVIYGSFGRSITSSLQREGFEFAHNKQGCLWLSFLIFFFLNMEWFRWFLSSDCKDFLLLLLNLLLIVFQFLLQALLSIVRNQIKVARALLRSSNKCYCNYHKRVSVFIYQQMHIRTFSWLRMMCLGHFDK